MFKVIDKKTGEEPDVMEIAANEEWAKNLMACDMEGFAIENDGTLLLIDECGRYEVCPQNRFEIQWGDDEEKNRLVSECTTLKKVATAADNLVYGTPKYSQDGSLLRIRGSGPKERTALEEALRELKIFISREINEAFKTK